MGEPVCSPELRPLGGCRFQGMVPLHTAIFHGQRKVRHEDQPEALADLSC